MLEGIAVDIARKAMMNGWCVYTLSMNYLGKFSVSIIN